MAPGDICLASFPFGDAPGMKLRLVLLLTDFWVPSLKSDRPSNPYPGPTEEVRTGTEVLAEPDVQPAAAIRAAPVCRGIA
jgi:hypothetical protein